MADNRGDTRNPSSVWGPNAYSAQQINLTRPDASTVGPGGNTVDPARINRITVLDNNTPKTQSKPLGQPHSR